VDDLGYRFAGLGMTLVVRQLVVFNRGAVFVFTLGRSQINVYAYSVYGILLQAKTVKTCAYMFWAPKTAGMEITH
jgi:hypothetical protein